MTSKDMKPSAKELNDVDLVQVVGAGVLKTEKANSLLAHELTHVTQQITTRVKNTTK